MNASIKKFLHEEDGVTALEYGLLAAVIAGVLVTAGRTQITTFFTNLFTTLSEVVSGAMDSASGT